MCDLETSRIGAPYIYDISSLRVKKVAANKIKIKIAMKKNLYTHSFYTTEEYFSQS